MSKTELYLVNIVKYGLYAILLTPLVFWPKALYAFLTPKFLLFQVLVEIVFGAWILLTIFPPKADQPRAGNPQYWPKFSWLTAALIFFAAVSLICALLGVDLARSVWGIGARMTGLFAEFHFLAWFLALVGYFKNDKKEWNRYVNFSFAVSILVALSAFYQNTQWHLVPGYTIFSNPTFVAPYFLFHFFWGLYNTIFNFQFSIFKLKGWLFGAGSTLILWAIFLGQIRGAFVGLFLGILFLGVGLIFSNIFKTRFRILIAVLYVIMILSSVLVWQYRDSKFIEQSFLGRFSHISFENATIQTRLLTWQAALKGFGSAGWRMLFSVGPENFNYLFNAHYNPHLLMYGGSSFAETWQDKPHNAFIEILTERGLIGSLAYILIWLCVAYCLFKIFKKGEKFLSLSLAAAFISYFGTMFFSFDSFGSWFGLYLFLAFLALSKNPDSRTVIQNSFKIKNSKLKILIPVVLIVVAYLILLNYSIWQANLADADALRTFSANPASGVALFKESLSYKTPYKSEYQFDLVASVGGAIEKGVPISNLEDTVNFALNEADKAILVHPNNAGSYTDMLRIYNILGTRGRDPDILSQAEKFGGKSLALSPNRQETLFYLARTALLKNDFKLAIELTKQAVEVDRGINLSHWYLGLAYIADNQREAGIAEIKKALEMDYRPQNQTEKTFIESLGL